MILDDAGRNRQSEPRPAVSRLAPAIDLPGDVPELVWWNPAATVADLQHDGPPLGARPNGHLVRASRVANRVVDEIVEHQRQPRPIAVHGWQCRLDVHVDTKRRLVQLYGESIER